MVYPHYESGSKKVEAFEILHNNPDKAHNLGKGF